jgi:predicted O-linked N-acetylglucosamine transferase (SPINDLY family)
MNYTDALTASEIASEHFRIGLRFSAKSDFSKPVQRNRKPRIGYLSSDFHCHPVGKIFKGLIAAHNTAHFDIYAYRDNICSDVITEEIRSAATVMRDTFGVSNSQVLDMIRTDELDVLFDLGGFTGGASRLEVFARRAAPIQISFLGYPHTTSLSTIDFRITDHFADPPSTADRFYAEKLIRLESGMLAWEPYNECRNIPRKTRSGPVTVGSFNNVSKISQAAIRCWAEILKRCPDVKLTMKYGDRFEVICVQDRIRRLFAEHGVMPNRIQFSKCCSSLSEHLLAMSDVDLALDSFPYQGTMTSLETLSVGTPVVSLAGDYYAHRATSAMQYRLGFSELVGANSEEYAEICVQLIRDPDGLRALRPMISERFFHSDLTKPAVIMSDLEKQIQQLIAGKMTG